MGATGSLYLAGGTGETNLPVSANAYQKTIGPNVDGQYVSGYIMELNPNFDMGGRTARIAALLALTFIAGLAERA